MRRVFFDSEKVVSCRFSVVGRCAVIILEYFSFLFVIAKRTDNRQLTTDNFFSATFLFLYLVGFALSLFLPALHADSDMPQMRASLHQLAPDASLSSSAFLKKENTPCSPLTPSGEHSKVFLATDPQAISKSHAVNREVVSAMLSKLVCTVTGKKNTTVAWQSLIKTGTHGDVIGIKVTTEPGLLSGTHRELIKALIKELLAAGVLREKIIVWDRRHQDLTSAGYDIEPGLSLAWIEEGGGYDAKQFFFSPLLGQLVYGDFGFQETLEHHQTPLSNESHYAALLTQGLDKVINIPSLCDNRYCGINGALASMTLGVVDNWRRFIKTPSCGDPYIPQLYATAQIRNKVVLTIMDALTLEYVGGPAASAAHTVTYGALLASFDPVAIDATGLNLINEERHAHGLPEVGALANYLSSAERLGLGHATKKELRGQSAILPYLVPVHHF